MPRTIGVKKSQEKYFKSDKGKKALARAHDTYYQKNKDTYNERSKEWQKNNPKKAKEMIQKANFKARSLKSMQAVTFEKFLIEKGYTKEESSRYTNYLVTHITKKGKIAKKPRTWPHKGLKNTLRRILKI